MTPLYERDIAFPWTAYNEKQGEFVRSKAKFLCGSGGKGGGKTVGLVRKTIMLLTWSEEFGDMAGSVGCIGRFKEKDFRRTTLPELRKWLPRSWIRNENKEEGWIELHNESVLYTAHYDDIGPITSLNLMFAAIDQMEEIPEEVFDELAYNRVRLKTLTRFDENSSLICPIFDEVTGECISTDSEEIAASLTFNTVFGACNPRRSWVYERFVKNELYRVSPDQNVREKYKPNYELIEIPTTENVRYIPKDYIEIQRADKSERAFNRDVLGLWDSFEGVIYLDFTDDLINKLNVTPHPEWKIYVGIDHGGTGQDPSMKTGITSVVFTAIEPRVGEWPLVHVFDELYLPGSTVEETVKAIHDKLRVIRTAQRFRFPEIVPNVDKALAPVRAWRCDPSMKRGVQDTSETLIDRYVRYGRALGMRIALTPGDNRVEDGIERNSWIMRNKLLRVNPKCSNFIDEHKAWERGSDEKPKTQQRDHSCNSWVYISSAYPFVHKRLDLPPVELTGFQKRLLKQEQLHRQGIIDPVYGYMGS